MGSSLNLANIEQADTLELTKLLTEIGACCKNFMYFNSAILDQLTTTYTPKLTLGLDLAATAGKVVYKNKFIELLQYFPTTDTVYATPILFVPPCINKYYILDLSPKDSWSLVKWLVAQGFVVYMISWVNPDLALAKATFADYVLQGPITAINVITSCHLHPKVHVVGYCIGGTLLNCALAYLAALNKTPIASATHLMTLLNFANLNQGFSPWLHNYALKFLPYLLDQNSYVDGRIVNGILECLVNSEPGWFKSFKNLLALKEPYASRKINNFSNRQFLEKLYLYWQNDPVNLPAKMYKFYLKNICLANKLTLANSLKINQIPIDLKKINVPIFMVAGSKDRITPWPAVYAGRSLYADLPKFLLVDAGHVTGVLDPPNSRETGHGFYIADPYTAKLPEVPQAWLDRAKKIPNSWWNYWVAWLTKIEQKSIDTQYINSILSNNYLIKAPGTYIYQRVY